MKEVNSKLNRLLYIDNIRLFLIILVIMHHVSIVYGGEGLYAIKQTPTDKISPILLTLFNGINQSFFMALFFLLSGYFVPASFDKKGAKKFLKDRFIRLGIPLLIYTTFFKVIIDYLILNFYKNQPINFFNVILYNIKNPSYMIGPLWFLEALLIFCLIYSFFRIIKPHIVQCDYAFPKNITIILTIIVAAILTFLIRIYIPVGKEIYVFQFAHFVNYTICFFLGIVAYRNKWLDKLPIKQAKLWKKIALTTIISLPIFIIIFGTKNTEAFLGGFSIKSLIYSTWETIACYSIIISLIFIFKTKLNKQGKLISWMAPNFYATYILHQLAIISIVIVFMGLSIPSFIKFFLVSFFSIALCFVISELIRKIPITRRVLG